MLEKLNLYELLNTVSTGALLMTWLPMCFPSILGVTVPKYPESFQLIVLIASAIIAGEIIQAISSLLEPVLYLTFGGRPSDIALRHGLGERYLPADTAKRIKNKLQTFAGSDASDHSLTLIAIQRVNGAGRVPTFSAWYSYHRAFFVLVVIMFLVFGISAWFGAAQGWTSSARVAVVATFILLVPVSWHRTRQRAYYYVRELFLTAERDIDSDEVKALRDKTIIKEHAHGHRD